MSNYATFSEMNRTKASILRRAVAAGREARAAQKSLDVDELEPETLLGECPYNAAVLLDALKGRWPYGCVYARRGALLEPGQPAPESLEDAIGHGQVHWWVEAVDVVSNALWVADLAAEVPERLGEPLVVFGRPEEYIAIGEVNSLAELRADPFFAHLW